MGHEAQNAMGLEEWRAKARAGEAPEGALLRKQFLPYSIVKEAGERQLTFTITTGAIDRDRDCLKVEGWRLDAYRANPVVLWAHDYRGLPVAKADSILTGAGALKATATFTAPDEYPFGDTVYRLLQGGFLRATSVGFRPIRSAYNNERGGYDFEEQELLEFSIVPVPANPEALMDAKAAGIELAGLKAWAEGVLDAQEPGLWLPKDVAARVLKIATGEPTTVPVVADKEPEVTAEKSEAPEALVFKPESIKAAIGAAVQEVVSARVRRELGRLD